MDQYTPEKRNIDRVILRETAVTALSSALLLYTYILTNVSSGQPDIQSGAVGVELAQCPFHSGGAVHEDIIYQ